MNGEPRKRSQVKLALALVAAGVFGFILLSGPSESRAAQESRFMGGNP